MLNDAELGRHLGGKSRLNHAATAEVKAPSNSVEVFLIRIWEELLRVRPIGVDQNFFDLGGHSFLAVKLMTRLEKAFGVKVPIAALFHASTIEGLGAMLSEHRAVADFKITPIQPHGSKPPFFCVDAFALFRPLALSLGADQPFLGLPRVDPNELQASFTIENIAAVHVRRIRAVQPEGPYHLGGWCVYGIIAYEIARQLRAEGQTVALLALFDSSNPAAYSALSSWGRLRVWSGMINSKIRFHVSNWKPLRPAVKLSYFLARMKTIRDEASQGAWRMLYRFHRRIARPISGPLLNPDKIEIAAAQTYCPRPCSGPILLFQPRTRPDVVFPDDAYGWTSVATGGVRIVEVPGTHTDMFREDNIATMAAELTRHLSPEVLSAEVRTPAETARRKGMHTASSGHGTEETSNKRLPAVNAN